MPTTRSRGNFETAFATWHIASSGLETITRTAFFDRFATSRVTSADDRLVRLDEVVAAHAGLARQAGCDHDDVRAGGLRVARRLDADHVRLVPEHRPGLVDVERLAGGEVRLHVDEHDVGVVPPGDFLRARGADVPGTDDGDLLSSVHGDSFPAGAAPAAGFSMIATPVALPSTPCVAWVGSDTVLSPGMSVTVSIELSIGDGRPSPVR